MLYSSVAPSGAVTVIVPVAKVQVGCVRVTAGVAGGARLLSVLLATVPGDTQVLSVVLRTVTV